MKRDPYKHKEHFERWLESVNGKEKVEGLTKINSELFMNFIKDMKLGINVSSSSKKGGRSFIRLNHLRQKLVFVLLKLEERGIKDIRDSTAKDLHQLFDDMRTGVIKTRFGTPYKSTGDYIKEIKTFWHWYQKVERSKNNIIIDITEDLDSRGEKPKFVYFTEEDFQNIISEASFDLKPIIALAYDSGMRVTELINTKVSDFSNDFTRLNIRDEVSKTFGRRINLMICPNQIREYVLKLNLGIDDYLCRKNPPMINKELRNIAKKVLSQEQIKFKNLSLYDFRHSSCCYWLPRYKSESGLKYRFGWKKSDMIHYYTELLGMKDTIREEDLYVDISKTDLEKEVSNLRNELRLLQESIRSVIEIKNS